MHHKCKCNRPVSLFYHRLILPLEYRIQFTAVPVAMSLCAACCASFKRNQCSFMRFLIFHENRKRLEKTVFALHPNLYEHFCMLFIAPRDAYWSRMISQYNWCFQSFTQCSPLKVNGSVWNVCWNGRPKMWMHLPLNGQIEAVLFRFSNVSDFFPFQFNGFSCFVAVCLHWMALWNSLFQFVLLISVH